MLHRAFEGFSYINNNTKIFDSLKFSTYFRYIPYNVKGAHVTLNRAGDNSPPCLTPANIGKK